MSSLFKRFLKVGTYICITVIILVCYTGTYCVQSFSRTVIFSFFVFIVFPKALLMSCYVTDKKWYRTYRYLLFVATPCSTFFGHIGSSPNRTRIIIFVVPFFLSCTVSVVGTHSTVKCLCLLHQHWARHFFLTLEICLFFSTVTVKVVVVFGFQFFCLQNNSHFASVYRATDWYLAGYHRRTCRL